MPELQDAPTAPSFHIPRAGEKLLIPLAEIETKSNTRKTFAAGELNELQESLIRNGQISPVVVHREGGKYVLDVGERRFRAFQNLAKVNGHFKKIEALVRSDCADGNRRLMLQIVENAQRSDLCPSEQADAIQDYIEQTGDDFAETGKALGWPERRVVEYSEFAQSPSALKAFGRATLRLDEVVTDDDGRPVTGENGQSVTRKKAVEPLPFSHLTRLTALSKKLDQLDQHEKRKNDRAKPVAEKSLLKIATKAALEQWSYKRLREEERKARALIKEQMTGVKVKKAPAPKDKIVVSTNKVVFSKAAFESASHTEKLAAADSLVEFFGQFGWTALIKPKD